MFSEYKSIAGTPLASEIVNISARDTMDVIFAYLKVAEIIKMICFRQKLKLGRLLFRCSRYGWRFVYLDGMFIQNYSAFPAAQITLENHHQTAHSIEKQEPSYKSNYNRSSWNNQQCH